jgi:hypothetical protein
MLTLYPLAFFAFQPCRQRVAIKPQLTCLEHALGACTVCVVWVNCIGLLLHPLLLDAGMQASLPHRSQPKEMMPRRPYALLSHTEQFGLTPLYKDDAAIAKSRERVRLLRTSGNLSSSHAEALDQRDLQNTGWYEQTYKWLPEHDGQSSFFESVSKLYWSQNGLQATS